MTDETPLIRATGVGKEFKLYGNPNDRVIEWATFGRSVRHKQFWALQDIDIELRRGECLGVIGKNGSGKSTMLKILSGALTPTTGAVERHGRVFALIELGTGFNRQLSGRKNVFHVGQMLGLDSDYLESRSDAIIEFADLGAFIDQPTKFYSSGMFARLAFSMFAFLEPDVLMIDEVLAVGDAAFQRKCLDLLEDRIRSRETAVMYVSHALRTIADLCTRVTHIDKGRILMSGEPSEVVHEFVQFSHLDRSQPTPQAASAAGKAPAREHQPRSAEAPSGVLVQRDVAQCPPGHAGCLLAIWLEDQAGDRIDRPNADQVLTICTAILFQRTCSSPWFRLELRDDLDEAVGVCETDGAAALAGCQPGEIRVIRCPTSRGIRKGEYTLGVRCRGTNPSGEQFVDEPDACTLMVHGSEEAGAARDLFQKPSISVPGSATEHGGTSSFSDYAQLRAAMPERERP